VQNCERCALANEERAAARDGCPGFAIQKLPSPFFCKIHRLTRRLTPFALPFHLCEQLTWPAYLSDHRAEPADVDYSERQDQERQKNRSVTCVTDSFQNPFLIAAARKGSIVIE
jgi:hypothetical protein